MKYLTELELKALSGQQDDRLGDQLEIRGNAYIP